MATGAGRDRRRAAGELEGEVLAALWATGEPLTSAEIQAARGRDLAYNSSVVRDAHGQRGAHRLEVLQRFARGLSTDEERALPDALHETGGRQ